MSNVVFSAIAEESVKRIIKELSEEKKEKNLLAAVRFVSSQKTGILAASLPHRGKKLIRRRTDERTDG